jgi:hypothetical protein
LHPIHQQDKIQPKNQKISHQIYQPYVAVTMAESPQALTPSPSQQTQKSWAWNHFVDQGNKVQWWSIEEAMGLAISSSLVTLKVVALSQC